MVLVDTSVWINHFRKHDVLLADLLASNNIMCHLFFKDSMEEFKISLQLDYAVAQSIFSHCGRDLLEGWLSQVAFHLKDDGALVATFLVDDKDYEGNGWVYPECVLYRPETVANISAGFGLDFEVLDWEHPRQTWALFSKKDYDKSLIQNGTVSWNCLIQKLRNQKNDA